MNFVRCKIIPSERSYKGTEIFWWDQIYVRASSYEMSSEDLKLALKFIIEAESSGIIGTGCAEMFKETRNIRQEFTVTTTRLDGMLLELFAWIRELLHYQKIQVAVQFFSAVLSCIPFAGGVVAHLLSSGSSVSTHVPGERLAVSGIVESLFGIGKDSSTLISEPVIRRVLQVTARILHKDTWELLPEENRTAVQDAADGLNHSLGDLRETVSGHATFTGNGVEVIKFGVVRIEEVDEYTEICTSKDSSSRMHPPQKIEDLTKEVRELKLEIQEMKKGKQKDDDETTRAFDEMTKLIEELRADRTWLINVEKENELGQK